MSDSQYEKAKVGAAPANAASPVLQPSQNRVRQIGEDLTGRNGRTVSDFLRYDSTENENVKSGLDGGIRFAAYRRPGAPNFAEKRGQLRDGNVPCRDGFLQDHGFNGNRIYADYEFLRGKHPEYFPDVEYARAVVEFVLNDPIPAGEVNGNPAFIRRDTETGTAWRIELRVRNNKQVHVRSAHQLSGAQYEKMTGRSDTPESVRPDRSTASGNRPKVDITGHTRAENSVSDFLRYDSTENENVKFSVSPVYTGSAADYESPSLNYVGTGEGAQVYGWGLYGSSSEDVARWYAKEDAKRKHKSPGSEEYIEGTILLDGKKPELDKDDIADDVLCGVVIYKGDISELLEWYRKTENDSFLESRWRDRYRACREWLEENKDRIQYIDHHTGRNLYKQTFWPGKEKNLLDWDKPVPEDQRRKIEEQLKAEGLYVDGDPDKASAEYRELKKRKNAGEDIPEKELDEAYEKAERLHAQRNVTGPTVNGNIPSGSMAYENLEDIVGEPKAVSEFLSRAGIDGVTYIGDSSGVRNYVAFSDKDIRVDEHIRFSIQDESDMAEGSEYSLETAAASKAGYRVERVNENAGREFNNAKGVIVQPEMIYKREEVPKEQPQKWLRERCLEYAKMHHVIGGHDAPALGDGVKVTVGSVKAVLNHPGSDIKNNLIAVIPDLLKDAVLIQTERLAAKNSLNQTHLLAAKVRYGENTRFIVGMVIHENQGKFYYDHELVEIENADVQNGRPGTTGAQVESASVINVIQNALFASGFEKKDGRNIRFSLNQYSDADWRDMVGYMKAKVGTLLTKPDADYRRILEEAGMECFSDADAHAIAAEAMEANRKDEAEAGRRRRDEWIYKNELTLWQVIDFAGSDDFKLVPDQWDGEKFTGTWIAPEYVEYSEKRPQGKTESDGSYKRYLNRREKKLKSAKGYRIDEVAEAIARKTGGDTLTIQEQLVDYFRDLKKPDLYHKYAEWRKQTELSDRDMINNLREEWEELQYSRAEEAIVELLENGREITRGWIRANRLAYRILYKQVFGKEAPRNPGKKDFEDLNFNIYSCNIYSFGSSKF